MNLRFKAFLTVTFAFVFTIAFFIDCRSKSNVQPKTEVAQTVTDKIDSPSEASKSEYLNDVPKKVIKVYEYILEYDKAMPGYVGGRIFQNREKKLPKSSSNGNGIEYREWDVNPKKPGKNRGAERLITGDNRSAYYTKDHYKTFIQFK